MLRFTFPYCYNTDAMKLVEEVAFRNKFYVFKDRYHAGELLAGKLKEYKGTDTYVLAIPAGGVPVGYIISKSLGLPLDVIVVRKIHIPWNQEAGFGAITFDGIIIFNERLLRILGLTKEEVDRCIEVERSTIERRVKLIRGGKPFPDVAGRTTILVDDGIASGYTMLSAVKSVERRKPKKIVVAVPTGSESAIKLLEPWVDEIVCLNVRTGSVFAVADAYKYWYDLTDEDVVKILKMIA
ncbi:phosphoribosyltransferase [Candidatus Bathyarchaeota archaeon]|nr:phosphoribosyltransferase [Candidatus Bathyarchaeota archaeon]